VKTKKYSGVKVGIPEGWSDITDECEAGSPFTLARTTDGVGALQFSIAEYQAGERPGITLEDLGEMLLEVAKKDGIKKLQTPAQSSDGLLVVSGEARVEEDLVRFWYLSNGDDLVFFTYLCAYSDRGAGAEEIADAEQIVRSVQFKRTPKGR
jgi:hypothetical protein